MMTATTDERFSVPVSLYSAAAPVGKKAGGCGCGCGCEVSGRCEPSSFAGAPFHGLPWLVASASGPIGRRIS